MASGAEGGLDDASALAIPTVMALVGSFFAILILSLGDAGASFTMVVGWGHPRRYCVAAAWGCGIFFSALNLLLAVLLQAVTTGIGALLGVGRLVRSAGENAPCPVGPAAGCAHRGRCA